MSQYRRPVRFREYVNAACAGKRKYLTPDSARRDARVMRRHDKKVTAFRCKSCRYWHVGSNLE